ncbi:autotransporter outer membrane beta-barrel domain-containing protein [Martelella soudanensis]|uniref:autotransporter outer membrane beta-barrel domain-containing protein n=1 Tax=unclassified Martelella TaxID=2629616 RepID=UPI0015DF3566|nr:MULTISPECIES: autotransporter outer membrane beta-barrel domain-containing protein [unclassified Martelella]
MATAELRDHSVVEMRMRPHALRATVGCFLYRMAVMGCLFLGGGFHPGEVDGARAAAVVAGKSGPDADAANYTIQGAQQCGGTVAEPQTFSVNADYKIYMNTGAGDKATGGAVDIGAPHYGTVVFKVGVPREDADSVIMAGSPVNYGNMECSDPQARNVDISFPVSPGNPNMLVMDLKENALILASCANGGLTRDDCGVFKGLGEGDLLFGKAMAGQRDDAVTALDALSSDAAMAAVSRHVREATADRMDVASGLLEEGNSGIRLWTTGYGSWSKPDGNGNVAAITDQFNGFLVGGDFAASPTMHFGGLAGYGHLNYQNESNNADGSSDHLTLGVYGGSAFDGFGVDFGAAYTWHDVSSRRNIVFSMLPEQITDSYNAGVFQLYGRISHRFKITDSFHVKPFLGAAYIHRDWDAFTELGGASQAENYAVLSAGLQTRLRHNANLGISYTGQFGDGTPRHNFRATLKIRF